MSRLVITISREFGAGGRRIGEKLSEALNVTLYDRSLISLAAKESGIAPELFEKAEDEAVNKLLFNLGIGGYVSTGFFAQANLPLSDQVFLAQSEAISRLAQKGGCVIMGRCGNYILRALPCCMNVFICGELSDRVKKISEKMKISEEEAEVLRAKTDKARANYYEHYTDWKWGDPHSFDVTVNTSRMSLDEAGELLLCAARRRATE